MPSKSLSRCGRCALGALGVWTCLATHAYAQQPQAPSSPPVLTAADIMARVAANQDRSDTERTHFTYVQHARVQSRKGKAIMCEETTDTRVTPSPRGQSEQRLSLDGHVRADNRLVHYTAPPIERSGAGKTRTEEDTAVSDGDHETVLDADNGNARVVVSDTDIDLVMSMRRNFTTDKGGKDGLTSGLFPLTSAEQKDMLFELKGREAKNGHDTFHINFRPKNKDDYNWKGDAWIDTSAFEPVVVRTALSRSLPLGVRALLGTNVPGLGFTVIYDRQANDVWFPASFGTEFKIRLFFFFSRTVVVDVRNGSFERTHVGTSVHTVDGQELSKAPAQP